MADNPQLPSNPDMNPEDVADMILDGHTPVQEFVEGLRPLALSFKSAVEIIDPARDRSAETKEGRNYHSAEAAYREWHHWGSNHLDPAWEALDFLDRDMWWEIAEKVLRERYARLTQPQ